MMSIVVLTTENRKKKKMYLDIENMIVGLRKDRASLLSGPGG